MAPARLSRIPASSIRSEPTGELPLLQPLVAPLNEAALRALLNLPLRQDLTKLKQHQQTTNTKIPDVVETITLLLQAQKERVEDRTARRKEKGEGPVEEDEEELRQLTEKVHDLSAQLEEGMRRGIDSQAKLEARESALKFAIEAARQQRSDRAANTSATQSTLGASQFRRQGTVDSDAEDGNEGTQAPPENAMLLLRRKEEELENEYNSSSMRHRLALNTPYSPPLSY